MTADQLMIEAARLGIALEARGDRLHVEAPVGVVTPELRFELARHKPALVALLAPVTQCVSLRGGLTVPLPALRLALDLEHRGFTMSLDEGQQFQIDPSPALTEADLAAIHRWRVHLAAIVGYNGGAHEHTQ
jgi:hypothetical protein